MTRMGGPDAGDLRGMATPRKPVADLRANGAAAVKAGRIVPFAWPAGDDEQYARVPYQRRLDRLVEPDMCGGKAVIVQIDRDIGQDRAAPYPFLPA